jgi:sec-independent protein translocase protein TatC
MIFPLILVMCLFFLLGAAFCFYVVLPLGIRFLLEFGTDELRPLISVGRYVSFVGWMVLAFGALFELPVVTFVLGRMGLVSARTLRRGRRYAIVGILIVAALVTPSPDVFSQLLLAVPLYLLYEISVALVAFTGTKRGIETDGAVSNG